MSVASSTIASRLGRFLLLAWLALVACDSDPTPIVEAPAGGASAQLASTNAPGGAAAVPGDGPDYKLGPNDRVLIIVFGQPTLTREYSLDCNRLLAFPPIGHVPAQGVTTSQLQKT